MINVDKNELLIRCSCGSKDHVAWLIYEPDDSRGNNLKAVDDDWYLSMTFDHFGFWKRVRKAFAFVFRPLSIKFGMSTELALQNEDVERIAAFIVEQRMNKRNEHAPQPRKA